MSDLNDQNHLENTIVTLIHDKILVKLANNELSCKKSSLSSLNIRDMNEISYDVSQIFCCFIPLFQFVMFPNEKTCSLMCVCIVGIIKSLFK